MLVTLQDFVIKEVKCSKCKSLDFIRMSDDKFVCTECGSAHRFKTDTISLISYDRVSSGICVSVKFESVDKGADQ